MHGTLCASRPERMRRAASWTPGRLCGAFAEHGPQRSKDRAQSKRDTVPGGTAARLNQAEGLPWRNGRKHGLARSSGLPMFYAGPTRSEAAHPGRKKSPMRVTAVLFLSFLDTEWHFWGGGPESAGFCEGPGPGMALEQNPFPARVPPGLAGTVVRR